MKPEDVTPKNFKVKNILYRVSDFSIAFGTTIKGGKEIDDCLAMRWDGDDSFPKGYPSSNGNPYWFFIPKELTACITKAVMDKKEIDAKL